MAVTDAFNDFMNWLSNGKVSDVPVIWVFLLIAFIIVIVYLVITRKPKQKEFKETDMKKEIKKDLDVQYKYFGEGLNKPIFHGIKQIGYAVGFMPMIWNRRLKKYENILSAGKQDYAKLEQVAQEVYKKAYKDLSDEQKKGVRNVAREESEQSEPAEIIDEGKGQTKFKFGKKEVSWDEPTSVLCFKVTSSNLLMKSVGSLIGIGTRYFLIDEKQIDTSNDGSIHLANSLQPQIYYGNMVFSKSAKDIIENTSFKINRQAEIQEIGNDVSRTVFWDNEFRKRAMLAREVSEIEAKKFRAQQESAQD